MTVQKQDPIVRSEMLIRKPVEQVFEAFIDPDITRNFWFTRGSGRVEEGKYIVWEWEMYGVSDEIYVEEVLAHERIRILSTDGTRMEWHFTARSAQETFVSIEHYGFTGTSDELLTICVDSMGGFTMVLCGLKAFLEHNIVLNLVADKAPDAHVNQ